MVLYRMVCLLGLCVCIGMRAQTNEPPRNVVKVSGGLDFVTSKVYLPQNLYYGRKIMASSWRPGVSALVDYEHFWKSGWGFGLNVIYNDTRYSTEGHYIDLSETKRERIGIPMRSYYVGPSVAYSGCYKKRWRYEGACGLGYGHISGFLDDYSGIGSLLRVGMEYMITSHFGVGAELNELIIFTSDDSLDDFKEVYPSESNVTSGLSRLGIAAGVRFYF